MAKVDAEHKTWARSATGYGGALLGKTACSTGYGVIIIGFLIKIKKCVKINLSLDQIIMCLSAVLNYLKITRSNWFYDL